MFFYPAVLPLSAQTLTYVAAYPPTDAWRMTVEISGLDKLWSLKSHLAGWWPAAGKAALSTRG